MVGNTADMRDSIKRYKKLLQKRSIATEITICDVQRMDLDDITAVIKKIVLDARYDDVLKDTAVLITDYSSIAYDAFYRGSRVVFYWEEKDYCLSQYGPSTKLMLNEGNVYGDVAYSTENLGEIIKKNYNNPQTEEYKNRYSKLVNFHDGKNTERLIEFLKKDGII